MNDENESRGTVLIVDDTLTNMRLLTQMLRDEGFGVRGAPNGEIALNAVRSAPPDVILLDINMPGLNGYEVCRELKADANTRNIPIIFLSALDEPLDKVRAFDVGGADYVSKPFHIEEVIARVEHQLQLQHLQRDLVEARIAAEAANQAKSAFLANMSHEIRTPMNAILGYAQIMSGDSDLSELHRRAVETIGTSGQHLLDLINDILDLSKIEAGREELSEGDFELSELIAELSALFDMRCAQKGLAWRLDSRIDPTRVRGDAKKLRQALINLLGNATKFTETGEVALVLQAEGDDRYRFEVRDTGPGIPADRQQQIFEPFQQEESGLKFGGTGLGLAISRRHVELMGGTIGVQSTEGEGAQFSITLPLPKGEDDVATPSKSESIWTQPCRLVPACSVRALVVDDIKTNREVLDHLLVGLGVEVSVAADGKSALRFAERGLDIAFIDIRMPGMDGLELLHQIRKRAGAPKAVAVSASALEHQKREFLEAGFDAFVGKPFWRGEICGCLVDLLGVSFEPISGETDAKTDMQEDSRSPGGEPSLSADQLSTLRDAAAQQNISGLLRCLEELEKDGFDSIVSRLRPLSKSYDFEAVRIALDEIAER